MICLDASVVGVLISPDELSDPLLDHYEKTRLAGETFIAPQLLPFEIASILRKKLLRRLLTAPEVAGALQYYHALNIQLRDVDQLMERSLSLCQTFGPTLTVYDASYVATAEAHRATLWTADQVLIRTVAPVMDFVRPMPG